MKKIFTGMVGFLLFIGGMGNVFAELPFAVTAEKVTVEGTAGSDGGGRAVVEDGKIVADRKPHDGMVEVQFGGIHYKLTFWNVGALKQDTARFFKTDYSEATLTLSRGISTAKRWRKADPGMFGEMFETAKDNFYQFDEISPPYIKGLDEIYHLRFSGGPYGTFTEIKPYVDKKHPLQGKLIENGRKVSFSFNGQDSLFKNGNLDLPRSVPKNPFSARNIGKYDNVEEMPTDCKDSGIRFSDYDGEVSIRPDADEDAWYGAELDMVLCYDDHVKTSDDSTCVLTFPDMTSFIMKPNSEVILAAPEKRRPLKIIAGKIWANVKRMVKDGTMDIEMSQAVAGIKGTTFVLEETGDTSTLKVIEGHVEFTSKTTGKSEMVNGGEMMTATKQGLEEKKSLEVDQENTGWEGLEADGKAVLIAPADFPKSRAEALFKAQVKRKSGGKKGDQSLGNTSTSKKSSWIRWLILIMIIGGGVYVWKKK